ncbi:uncharacterized protein LOC107843808 [Capsicum annuum]|uniref:uncharacterized protein LOC107843808 n=1 Tax=Capsicum annuum TaxID=4072 RepID=UPI0007BF33C4|nr:uncharacterized protein LOC107843808 [Capsicum annuum]
MMEHLHTPFLDKPDVIDRCMPNGVRAMDLRMRLDKFSLPMGFDAWIDFLESRTEDNILWTYLWLRPKVILLGCQMQLLLVMLKLNCTRPYTPSRVMRQLGRSQDVPPVVDLLKDVEYFKDQALGESKYKYFWNHATKLGVDTFKEGLDNLGYTQRYEISLQTIPWGISRPLPLQLRGRIQEECIVDDSQDESAGSKVETLRVQLSDLLKTVERCQNNLCRCTPHKAGIRARKFFPNIRVSLQDMRQNLNGRRRTSQTSPSQPGSSCRAPV